MNTIEQIIKNEPLEEIVTVFALLKAPPHLDMMIRRHNIKLIQHGELERTYTKLFKTGVLANGKKGLCIKGPNWKAPKFFLEKRYT
ncbi:hypothetical protein FGE05_14180 [Pseudomonas sp. ICMP22404]|uniref:hypothetical protein n=1 Tax=Pseudomonas TaxID=286 RepID=UPI00111A30C5|nr:MULTISPECIES: hypothetical protein [Pseudomonas]MCI0994484.1 hypothetical protein [Pseudomonas corrugata]NUT66178.1 hypothetical protein [Pseudomonas corrugata]TNF82217.1 hypothetical protein FGE05_14180 [Pseudomonas sp. ICMP22404]